MGKYRDKLKLAVVNFQPVWGNKEANLKKMVAYANSAADNGANLVLFPELALTGYAIETGENIKRSERMQVKLAETVDGTSAQTMAEVAKEKGIYIVYGYPEKKSKAATEVYNSAVAMGPEGIIGSYQKVHPFDIEVIWCYTGKKLFMFDTPWGPIGISICYDTYNYPEISRCYGAAGARLVLNPTATSWAYYSKVDLVDGRPLNDGKPTNGNNVAWLNRFKSRVEAVVIQSGIFVATADLVGAENDSEGKFMGTAFPGGSFVVGPSSDERGTDSYFDYCGTDPAQSVDEGVVYSEIDLSRAKRNSFANYINTDVQNGNLYSPELYAQWFSALAKKGYKALK